jgi:hypothetical protein
MVMEELLGDDQAARPTLVRMKGVKPDMASWEMTFAGSDPQPTVSLLPAERNPLKLNFIIAIIGTMRSARPGQGLTGGAKSGTTSP